MQRYRDLWLLQSIGGSIVYDEYDHDSLLLQAIGDVTSRFMIVTSRVCHTAASVA